jgi:hypothetical protein
MTVMIHVDMADMVDARRVRKQIQRAAQRVL